PALDDLLDVGDSLALDAQFTQHERLPGGSRVVVRSSPGAPDYVFVGELQGQLFRGELVFEVGDTAEPAGRLRMTGLFTEEAGPRVDGFLEGSGPDGCFIESRFTLDGFTGGFDPEMGDPGRTIERLVNLAPTYCAIDETSDTPPQPKPEVAANGLDDDCDGLVDEPPALDAAQAFAETPVGLWTAPTYAGSCAAGVQDSFEDFLSTEVDNFEFNHALVQTPTADGSLVRAYGRAAAEGWIFFARLFQEPFGGASPSPLVAFEGDFVRAPGALDFLQRVHLEGVFENFGSDQDRIVARYRAFLAPDCVATGEVALDDLPAGFEPIGALAFAGAPGADKDGDGVADGIDCNDFNPAIAPGLPELPGNFRDDDCDGLVDEGAPSALGTSADLHLVDLAFGAACTQAEQDRLLDLLDDEDRLRFVEALRTASAPTGAVSSLLTGRVGQADGSSGLRLSARFVNGVLGVNTGQLGLSRPCEGGVYFNTARPGDAAARLTLEGVFAPSETGSAFDDAVYGRLFGALTPTCGLSGGFVLDLPPGYQP
ncbi:MAG: putative metal-binding motif-containing protein, partial [Candidatus Methylomirabilis sp.]|nr:putative metal-binding motif-containing protein [Deltaproteobacteria bacterium]